MHILTAKDFKAELPSFEFAPPIKGSHEKEYRSILSHPNGAYFLKTPPLKVHTLEEKTGHVVVYAELPWEQAKDLYTCIRGLESKFLSLLTSNPGWIGAKTSPKYLPLSDFFASSILLSSSSEEPFYVKFILIPESSLLFDLNGRKISLKRLKEDQTIVFLLKFSYSLFLDQKISLPITVSQARIYNPPEKDSDLLIEFSEEEE